MGEQQLLCTKRPLRRSSLGMAGISGPSDQDSLAAPQAGWVRRPQGLKLAQAVGSPTSWAVRATVNGSWRSRYWCD